jgi:hypothetical protein
MALMARPARGVPGNDLEMSDSSRNPVEGLRNALLELSPAGADGFEGLLRAVLTQITGIPFRLAGSGAQSGIDGGASYPDDGVCFEAKRYSGQLPKNEVLAKIAEVSIQDKGDVDLWILGATTAVTSQSANDIEKFAAKSGIPVLILDWSSPPLPPLAVTLALGADSAVRFFSEHQTNHGAAAAVAAALLAIKQTQGFDDHALRIRGFLEQPTIGSGPTHRANERWLTRVFSDKRQARRYLGQPLCPGHAIGSPATIRRELIDRLSPCFSDRPDGRIAIVLGDEGTGKSWLVAQTWMSLSTKPLMVVFTPEDFVDLSVLSDLEKLLCDRLTLQSGGTSSADADSRWRRRFARWRTGPIADSPRVVVVIDGLNQRPEVDWARVIESMSSVVDQVHGRLVVTTRTDYFENRTRQRLYSATVKVNVPEWTDVEREEILSTHGLRANNLRPRVAASLRNPRLLGVALELLHDGQIEEMEELSVSRLLFEHIRVQERDAPTPRPAGEFARLLRNHAYQVLDRLAERQRDDLRVFDGGLEAVSSGRFFVPTEGDPTRYSLTDDGLTLALGLAILDRLRTAYRNRRDLGEALQSMIEPVSALDETSAVLSAALMIACVTGHDVEDITASLVCAYANLQNPNSAEHGAVVALAQKRPGPFMLGARLLCLAGGRQPNFDLVVAALYSAEANHVSWSEISAHLHTWLRHYSLSPDQHVLSRPSTDEAGTERLRKQHELDSRLSALADAEREILNELVRVDDGNVNALGQLAFELLAGKPVAPFAMSLSRWSFANALCGTHRAPVREFNNLIRLNIVDWPEARDAIASACRLLGAPEISAVGRRALISLLKATGDSDNAREAEALASALPGSPARHQGWRLVEDYCAEDPCDPASEKPSNIARTAQKYSALDAKALRLDVGGSESDHFFALARPGIARFETRTGVDKHREFIADVAKRTGTPLRQGVLEMRHHSALVTREVAAQLVRRVTDGSAAIALHNRDQWIAQFHLVLAFPLLSASEQLQALLSRAAGDTILLQLMAVAKPLEEDVFENALLAAVRDRDERAQFVVLSFGLSTRTDLSPGVRRELAALARSHSAQVRAQAMGLIALSGHDEAILSVAQSDWSGTGLTEPNLVEAWHGSRVLIEAIARSTISQGEALPRIAPSRYGYAARRLGGDVAREIARRVDFVIARAVGLRLSTQVPDIEFAHQVDAHEPSRPRVSAKTPSASDQLAFLRQATETDEAFDERQRVAHAAFAAFKRELTRENARLIVEEFSLGEFDAIVEAAPDLADRWYEIVSSMPPVRRALVHNLGVLLAHSLAYRAPNKAANLFELLDEPEPLVRTTFGRARVPLTSMAVWSAADGPALEDLRLARLDKCTTDYALSIEVLAALLSRKQSLLESYVTDRFKSGRPANVARGLMVAGFSESSAFNAEALDLHRKAPGFIGRVEAVARYAYERNEWSESWFRRMRETDDPDDFWRCSVLLTTIVDGRCDAWATSDDAAPLGHLLPTIEDQLRSRVEKRNRKRRKTLFGDEAPSPRFLQVL